MTNSIKCPECGASIEVGQLLADQISSEIEHRVRNEEKANLTEAIANAKLEANENNAIEIKDLQNQLAEKSRAMKDIQEHDLELRALERSLKQREADIEKTIDARLGKKKSQIEKQIKDKITSDSQSEIESLKQTIGEHDKEMSAARKRELEILKEKRDSEDRANRLELEYAHKYDEQRRKLEREIEDKYAKDSDLKLKERDQQIESLRNALSDAKRKSEQGSMETQGEALENDLESTLSAEFSTDTFSPVPKGIRGADIIQTVHGHHSMVCGTIAWEAKNTKAWNSSWIEKLKDDQREIGASLSVLVSNTLPDGIKHFTQIDGVWVVSLTAYCALAYALREQLIQVSFVKGASEGKSEKMEILYEYLSGDTFYLKVEAIVDTFVNMQDQLNKEKRAFQRIWKEREKQIQRIVDNTAGMYGDIRGLIGSSIPEIQALSLDSIEHLPNEQ